MYNMERICHTASEEKSFENVDGRQTNDGRTTDACIYYKLTYGSGELKNEYPCKHQFCYIKVGCTGVYITRTCLHDVWDYE